MRCGGPVRHEESATHLLRRGTGGQALTQRGTMDLPVDRDGVDCALKYLLMTGAQLADRRVEITMLDEFGDLYLVVREGGSIACQRSRQDLRQHVELLEQLQEEGCQQTLPGLAIALRLIK